MKKAIVLFLFIQLLAEDTCAQIEHVEPLNWWVNMKSQELQLMVHGKDVGYYKPDIKYPGVTVVSSHPGDSKNYLFINLKISPQAQAGQINIRFLYEGKVAYIHKYELLRRQKPAEAFKGFSSADVIYLITPDRFVNGDSTNDIVDSMREKTVNRAKEGARHGGDIRGIINSLDYLQEMGFTAIWPQPMLENNMAAYSYHGYAITNSYRVDPRFGTLEEYKELASKAAAKGIKLIFDDVVNHSGSNYWWMKDLPFKNWVNFPDSVVITNHKRTVNQDPYASGYDRSLMNKGWFDYTMPDLNNANPYMAKYLVQRSIWWIETLQLGGIRQDTYPYSDKQFLKNWSCAIMREYPNFNIVGEEWSLNPLITSYWQNGQKNKDGYSNCLKTMMDFPLLDALVKALLDKEENKYNNGFNVVYESLANDFIYPDPENIMVFGDNHDMDRIYTQLGNDVGLTKMAMTFLLTIRGIPQVYYGTEILAENAAHRGNHGFIRTDFPGGWAGDKTDAFTGSGLRADQKEFQGWMKKMLNWRKNNDIIAHGKLMHFAPDKGVYTFFRYDKSKMVMVIFNNNLKGVDLGTKKFAELLKDKNSAKDVISGRQFSLTENIALPAKTAVVLEIN
jgi:glycosidase